MSSQSSKTPTVLTVNPLNIQRRRQFTLIFYFWGVHVIYEKMHRKIYGLQYVTRHFVYLLLGQLGKFDD
jgi:hypothetical protein